MLSADATKRVLAAILHTLPDEGPGHLTRLEIREGWGDIVHVRLRLSPAAHELARHIRSAVADALGGVRHRIEIDWE